MRVLMDIAMPHEPFNTMTREGIAGKRMSEILDTLKPESAYFCEIDGKRGAIIVVDLSDPSKIPSLAEPWFLSFNADVKIRVVMSAEDLKNAGLDSLGKKWANTPLQAVR
jgi:hypothetical protein